MIYGVDVASYQAEKFPTKGYSFAIVKATEGTSYTNPRAGAQVAHARRNGLHVGHYHFARRGSVQAQVDYFLAKAPDRAGDSFWIDWEDTAVSNASKDAMIKAVKKARPNAKVGLYCNVNFWLNYDKTSYAGDALWIARYGGTPGKPGIRYGWLIHQYSEDGGLDKNVARFKSKAEMIAWAGGKESYMALTNADIAKIAKTDGAFGVSARMRAGNPTNEEWKLESILSFLGDGILDLKEQLGQITNRLVALEGKVDTLDLSEVGNKVRAAVEDVEARLVVESE